MYNVYALSRPNAKRNSVLETGVSDSEATKRIEIKVAFIVIINNISTFIMSSFLQK